MAKRGKYKAHTRRSRAEMVEVRKAEKLQKRRRKNMAVAVEVGIEALRLFGRGKSLGVVEFCVGRNGADLWVALGRGDERGCESTREAAARLVASWAGLKLVPGYLRPSIKRNVGFDVVLPSRKAKLGGWARTMEEGVDRLEEMGA